MKKAQVLRVLGASVLIFAPLAALAVDSSSVTLPEQPAVVAPQTQSTENVSASLGVEKSIDRLIAEAKKLANDRVTALEKLKSKILNDKLLTDEQKNPFYGEIDANIAAMKQFITDVTSGSLTLDQLRAKIKSIYADYRIFAVFNPKISLQVALNSQLNYAKKVEAKFTEFQNRLEAAAKQGVSVTSSLAILEQAKTKLQDAKTKIDTALSNVATLKPADYPTKSAEVIASSKSAISAVNQLFKDINNMVKDGLRILRDSNASLVADKKAAQAAYQAALKTAHEQYRNEIKAAQDKLAAAKQAALEAYKQALAKPGVAKN